MPTSHKLQYRPIKLVKAGEALDDEILRMGPMTIRVLEDGSNTDNRLGTMILGIKGGAKGPVVHWHRMHDETFLVLKGKLRFTTDKGNVDTSAGDYVIVPTRSIHTFSNPFEEDAEFFMTLTPAYYVDYLRMLAKAINEAMAGGKMLTEKEQRDIMAQFATFEPGEVGVEL